ncbi:MAG: hypothetical protein Q8N96_05905 [Methylovulum sp.]|nr:hypothetical protein [Methylovulum sp.]
MKRLILILLAAMIAVPVQSEVFKCQAAGQKTIYQAAPCPATAVNQQIIEVEKLDPAKVAQAQARLKAWQADLAEKAAAKRKIQKELQEALDKQAVIDALNRNAAAQEELAEAAKRPVIINQPVVVNPFIRPHRPHGIRPNRANHP